MRVALFSFGSRGDSEPLAALARALQDAGHEAALVTQCEEHLGLGFEAHHWDEAFPLRLGRPQPPERRMGRNFLLHLPAVLWLFLLLAAHLLSVPLLLLRPSGLRALRHKGLDGLPSLVDRVMLGDAVVRPQWSLRTPRSRFAFARWLGPLLARYPVPSGLLSFMDAQLARADLVVIGEGADDPARERLLLWLASRRGLRCVRTSAFPRERPAGIGHPHWLPLSAFPVLLGPLSPGGPLRQRASHWLAGAMAAGLRLHSLGYGLWYGFADRVLLRSPRLLSRLDAWLAERGAPPLDWATLMRPDYASFLRGWAGEPLLPDPPGGFWPLAPPPGFAPPPELEAFLAGGEAVWVSRVARSRGVQEALAAVLERRRELRCVVNLPPGEARAGLGDHPRVHFVASVAHEWLLPRVVAAVHHGGAGTTAAALRAGLPSLVLPTWGDQTLWAQRVCATGAGPRPVHVRWIEDRGLERGLRALLEEPRYRERAAELGRALRRAPGPEAAVAELEAFAARSAPVDDGAVVE